MPHKKLFQSLRHANFLGYVFTKGIIEKLPNFKSLPNKKYLCWDNETLNLSLCQTHTNTQKKMQVAAIFRDIAIRILVMVHFCESKLY
jgi:hypothetical protein